MKRFIVRGGGKVWAELTPEEQQLALSGELDFTEVPGAPEDPAYDEAVAASTVGVSGMPGAVGGPDIPAAAPEPVAPPVLPRSAPVVIRRKNGDVAHTGDLEEDILDHYVNAVQADAARDFGDPISILSNLGFHVGPAAGIPPLAQLAVTGLRGGGKLFREVVPAGKQPPSLPKGEKWDRKKAAAELKEDYPQLPTLIGELRKLGDPSTYADMDFEFKDWRDIFKLSGYLMEKPLALQARGTAGAIDRFAGTSLVDMDTEMPQWEQSRYAAAPMFAQTETAVYALGQTTKASDIILMLSPGSDALKALHSVRLAASFGAAKAFYDNEKANGFPWARNNRETLSAVWSVPFDWMNHASNLFSVIGKFDEVKKVGKLEEVLETALVRARETLNGSPKAARAADVAAWKKTAAGVSERLVGLDGKIAQTEGVLKNLDPKGVQKPFSSRAAIEKELAEVEEAITKHPGSEAVDKAQKELAAIEKDLKRADDLDEHEAFDLETDKERLQAFIDEHGGGSRSELAQTKEALKKDLAAHDNYEQGLKNAEATKGTRDKLSGELAALKTERDVVAKQHADLLENKPGKLGKPFQRHMEKEAALTKEVRGIEQAIRKLDKGGASNLDLAVEEAVLGGGKQKGHPLYTEERPHLVEKLAKKREQLDALKSARPDKSWDPKDVTSAQPGGERWREAVGVLSAHINEKTSGVRGAGSAFFDWLLRKDVYGEFTSKQLAESMYHGAGLRPGTEALPVTLPFQGAWRTAGDMSGLPGTHSASRDLMRHYEMEKRLALGGKDGLEKGAQGVLAAVRESGHANYTREHLVADTLELLYALERAPGDTAASMDRSYVLKSLEVPRLRKIPTQVFEYARDLAVRLGNGNKALADDWSKAWPKAAEELKEALEPRLFGDPANLSPKDLARKEELLKSKSVSARWEVFTDFLQTQASKSEREFSVDRFVEGLQKIRADASDEVEAATRSGLDVARSKAVGVVAAADEIISDVEKFRKTQQVPGVIPDGKYLEKLKRFNGAARFLQLFTVPATQIGNAINSIIEKPLLGLGASRQNIEEAATTFGKYVTGGRLPAPTVGLDGSKLSWSADIGKYVFEKSGAMTEYPGFLRAFLTPDKGMTYAESLARQMTGNRVYWDKVGELERSFPGMREASDAHRIASEAASGVVSKMHFNADDLPGVLRMARYAFGYPDFTARDAAFMIDILAKHPSEVMALGRTVDAVRRITAGDGVLLGTIGETEVRWKPEQMLGMVRAYDNWTKWRELPERDPAMGDFARAGVVMEHYGEEFLRKAVGTMLPHARVGIYLASRQPRETAPTANAFESLAVSANKSLFGFDFRPSDALARLVGKNPGEAERDYNSKAQSHLSAAYRDADQEKHPLEVAREYNDLDALDRGLNWLGRSLGISVAAPVEHPFNLKVQKARDQMRYYDATGQDMQSFRDFLSADPEMKNVVEVLPLAPSVLRSLRTQNVPVGGEPDPNPPPPTHYLVKPSTGNPYVATAAQAAYSGHDYEPVYTAEPVAGGAQAQQIPAYAKKDLLTSYTRPDSVQYALTNDGGAVGTPVYNQTRLGTFRVADQEKHRLYDSFRKEVLRARMFSTTPQQFIDELSKVRTKDGKTQWAMDFLRFQRDEANRNGVPYEAHLGQIGEAFAALDVVENKARPDYMPNDAALSPNIKSNARRVTNWLSNEVSAHGGSDALRRQLSTYEGFIDFAEGRSSIKPMRLPKTLDIRRSVDEYTLRFALDNIKDTVWGMAASDHKRRLDRDYPELGRHVGQLQDALSDPRKMSGAIKGLNDAIAAGDRVPPNAWDIIQTSPNYRNLYDKIGVTSTFDEAKPLLSKLVRADKSGRPTIVNPAALFQAAFGKGYEDLRPYVQAARTGSYGQDIKNSLENYINTLPENVREQLDRFVPADTQFVQAFFDQESAVAIGDFRMDSSTKDFLDILGVPQVRADMGRLPQGQFTAQEPSPVTAGYVPASARVAALTAAPITGPSPNSSSSSGGLMRTLPSVPELAAHLPPYKPAPTSAREIAQEAITTSAREGYEYRQSMAAYKAGGSVGEPPKQPQGAMVNFGAGLSEAMASDTISPAGKASLALQSIALANSAAQGVYSDLQKTGDVSGEGDGAAAMYGLNNFASTYSNPGGAMLNASTLGAYGVYVGIKSGLNFGKSNDQARQNYSENFRINQERLDLERERYAESLRQQSIRDIRQREQDLASALRGGASIDRRGPVEARLAAFTRRPTYSSRIGLVDAVERAVSASLKPRW